MDAQGTMRLMFDTMDAYDRADFDRLGEVYAEDAQWRNADPEGPHCRNRDDIFAMFRQNMDAGIRIGFDELRSTPTHVVLTARVNGYAPVVSVFTLRGTPDRGGTGLPLEEGRRGGDGGSTAPVVASMAARVARLSEDLRAAGDSQRMVGDVVVPAVRD